MPKQRALINPSPFVPRLHAGESLFSFTSRAWSLSCRQSESDFVGRLYGGLHRSVSSVVSENRDAAAELDKRMSRINPKLNGTLQAKHSLQALADPFRFPKDPLTPRQRLTHDHQIVFEDTKGIGATPFRYVPAHCLECTREDKAELGYSYWRRNHQPYGVKLCAKHHAILIDRCLLCGTENNAYQSPSLDCGDCGYAYSPAKVLENDKQRLFHIRLSETVAAMYRAEIRGPLDNHAVTKLFGSMAPPKSKVPGTDLFNYIRSVVGDDYLKQVGLQAEPSTQFQWPTLFYTSRFILSEAMAQLVIYSALTLEEPQPDLFLPAMPTGRDWVVSDRREVGFEVLWAELRKRASSQQTSVSV